VLVGGVVLKMERERETKWSGEKILVVKTYEVAWRGLESKQPL